MTKTTPPSQQRSAAPNPSLAAPKRRWARPFLRSDFLRSETGAVTIDWVVLSAAMVLLVASLFSVFSPVVMAKIATIFL